MDDNCCILYLLNPGRTSRAYVIGLINAARRLGLKHQILDLSVVWERQQRGDNRNLTFEVSDFVKSAGITHVIGYGYNGLEIPRLTDLDPTRPLEGQRHNGSFFLDHGIRHLSLWTDHPNWCMNGAALHEPLLSRCSHNEHYHFLKSKSAASEAAGILGWPRVMHLQMAEDFESIKPIPESQRVVDHDAVMLLSDAKPVADELASFLDADDPDPREMCRCIKPRAIKAAIKAIRRSESSNHPPQHAPEDFNEVVDAWAELKISQPHTSLWTLSTRLESSYGELLRSLQECPHRWYAVTQGLRELVTWRRNFWPAWVARRIRLGVYGCDASCWGVRQDAAAREWVSYSQQSQVYSKGPCALNINAGHDEEGLTHKPFQIAAAGVGCVHHYSRGLEEVFDLQEHVCGFERGPELLAAIEKAPQKATALLTHARTHHRWENRLAEMLEVSMDADAGHMNPTASY